MHPKIHSLPAILLGVGLLVNIAPSAHCAPEPNLPITLPASDGGTTVDIEAGTGTYTVSNARTKWTFRGSVGSPFSQVKTVKGRDSLGSYREATFNWKNTGSWQGSIRNYQDRPLVSFAITSPQSFAGPAPDFPAFSSFPQNLHPFSFRDGVFSPPNFGLSRNSTPWMFFDDNAQTAILSPASNFFVAQMHGDGQSLIASGTNPQLTSLPVGFTHKSFLVMGSGIRDTFRAWGKTLTDLSNKPRTTDDADELIKYLGYWTDNGAYYYYNYDTEKGYAGTMLALQQHYKQQNIPIKYLQLDSWWYQKSRRDPSGKEGAETAKNAKLPVASWNIYGGTMDYSASPDLFPQGLGTFQKQLGLPLAVHARWIDRQSPYTQNYKISGVAAVDPRWWDERMSYLKNNGVITYEQDWLNEIYNNTPDMARTVDTGPAFADNMARAAKANGLTLQYCMATPRYFLQGSNYSNLTTIRTSEDRFERNKWNNFLYTSLFADALNMRPWVDVFLSTEMGNVTIATLSSGPVGWGDAIGNESKENLQKTARADGVIIKPDAPLTPTDASFIAQSRQENKPLVASTYTDNGVKTAYVFAYTRRNDTPDVAFTPASLGLSGPVVIYNTTAQTVKKQNATDTFQETLAQPNWAMYQIAPVGPSGITFLGDSSKIVGTGRQRIAAIKDERGGLSATVLAAPGETTITLHGYAAKAPLVIANGGTAQPVSYDEATGHFSVQVSPLTDARPKRINGDMVNQFTVKFRLPA